MLESYGKDGEENLWDIVAKDKKEFMRKVSLAAFSKDLTHIARKWNGKS